PIALALVRETRGKFAEAEELFQQALSLDPGNPDALHHYGISIANVGRLKEAVHLRLQLRAQEPLVPQFNRNTALVLWATGRTEEAITVYKAIPSAPM